MVKSKGVSERTSITDEFRGSKAIRYEMLNTNRNFRSLREVILIGLQQEQYNLVYGYNSRHAN